MSETRLRAFVRGDLPVAELLPVQTHLESCSACRERLEHIEAPDPRMDRLRAAMVSLDAVRDDTTPTDGLFEQAEYPGYQIVRILGQGGVGIVYLARQISLNRLVALKSLRTDTQATPVALTRFRREGETLARLQHPNIVRVFDIGTAGQRRFLTMEYADGGSLADLLVQRRLTPRESAELVRVLAEAIQSAHDQGIIHRDLKPANVLLQRPASSDVTTDLATSERRMLDEFVPKIADFGLVFHVDPDLRLTQTGAIAGSPSYMSPEQAVATGEPIGPASDVYSLGAILYELLTGEPPFQRPSTLETLQAVQNDEPTLPSHLQDDVPRELDTICLKCLEKRPVDRYRSARSLAEDLRRYLTHEPILAAPIGRWLRLVRWSQRNRQVASALALVMLMLAILAIGSSTAALLLFQANTDSRKAAAAERRERSKAERATRIAQNAEFLSAHRLVAGYLLAGGTSVRDRESTETLLWYQLAWRADDRSTRQTDQHQLRLAWQISRYPELVGLCIHSSNYLRTAWSGDLRRVALVTDPRAVELWNPYEGQRLNVVTLDSDVEVIAMNSTGKTIAIAEHSGAIRICTESEPVRLLKVPAEAGAVTGLALAPNEPLVAAARGTNQIELWSLGTDPSIVHRIDAQAPVQSLTFGPRGDLLLSQHDDGAIRLWDVASGQRVSEVNASARSASDDAARPSFLFSRDGQYLFTAAGQSIEWRVAATGAVTKRVEFPSVIDRWSCNGRGSVVAVLGTDREVYLWSNAKSRTSGPQKVTTSYPVSQIAVSDDGQTIALFMGRGRICMLDSASRRVLAYAYRPLRRSDVLAWSDDGKDVMAISRDATVRIWRMPKLEIRPQNRREAEEIAMTASGSTEGDSAAGDASSSAKTAGGTSDLVVATRFSRLPFRRLTLTAANDLQVWDAATNRRIGEPIQHTHRVSEIAFSEDGHRIAVFLNNNTLKIYDADTGDALGTERMPAGEPAEDGLKFSADHRGVELLYADGRQHRFEFPALNLNLEESERLTELLTGQRLDVGTQRIIYLPPDLFTNSPEVYLQTWRKWRAATARPSAP